MSGPARWALITGGAKRLGRACALELAGAGWGVVVQYRSSAIPAVELLDELRKVGGEGAALEADLTNAKGLPALIEDADNAAGGRLVGLVNCAARFDHDDIHSMEPETFEAVMRVNALAPSLLAKAFAARTPGRAGCAIVNFLDFKLANPYPDHFSYTLSKYALEGATQLLARALAPGVRVNAVAPGYVLPAPDQAQADFERLHDSLPPLKRGVTMEDISGAVRYLLEAEALTGQTLFVDGGLRFRSFERDMSFL
ncbi:MAG: SDR family oxidoreductase [Alphaproteobacteria bacterium]|nr:SDR family oxidoreductase [Alphaproteobacteria bacterium]